MVSNEPLRPDAARGDKKNLRAFLDRHARRLETPAFVELDPVSVPHGFSAQPDREIAGFIAATFAWGQRVTILAKARDFLERMDGAPYDFVRDHSDRERRRFATFVHRTFQPADAEFFLRRLQRHYREHASLEPLFTDGLRADAPNVEGALRHFHDRFFEEASAPARCRKHVATPARKSSCKRLNMFLRWMVRPAAAGVDLGLWRGIHPRQLVIPLDVHVQRNALDLGLLSRKQADWTAAAALTEKLKELCPEDPVRYDFALFGLGVEA